MLIWIVAAVFSYFIKGVCGFANTLVFTSLMSFFYSNVAITPVELLLGLPSNLILVWKDRRLIRKAVCLPAILLILIGSVAGTLFLKSTDTGLIKRIFGIVTLCLSAEMLLREIRPGRPALPKAALAGIGVLSGLLCGLFNIGALMSVYIRQITPDTRSFKANLCAVFLAESAFRTVLYTALGILTADILRRALLLAPFMLLGLGLGMRCCGRLKERTVRLAVCCLLLLSGLLLIVTH